MLTNSGTTIYHKTINETTRLESWVKTYYPNSWWFGSSNASVNKGYEDSDEVNVRISYKTNTVNLGNIKIGDILVKGEVSKTINTQKDLKGYEIYNITSIKDNNFGTEPHLHLGGK